MDGLNTNIVQNPLIKNDKNQNTGMFGDPNEVLKYAGVGTGVSWAIGKGLDSFCKSSSGDYKKTLLGKFLEKVDHWSVNNKYVKTVNDGIISLKKRIIGNHKDLITKSDDYRKVTGLLKEGSKIKSLGVQKSIADKLQDELIKSLKNQQQYVDYKNAARNLKILEGTTLEKLRQRAASGRSGNLTQKLLKNLESRAQQLVSNTPKEVVVEAIRKQKGEVSTLVDNTIKKSIRELRNPKTTGQAIETLKNSPLYQGQIKNTITKMELLRNPKSPLAKFVSKFVNGTANYMGNGHLGNCLVTGLFIGMSIKSAFDAPKGEKFSTFMEDIMVNWLGGFLLFSPALKAANALSNLKNIGAVANSPIWKKVLQGSLKTVGKIASIGQNNRMATIGKAVKYLGKDGKLLKVAGWLGKGIPGGMVRLAIAMALLMPVNAVMRKISHALFGKPTQRDKKPENNTQNPQQTANNAFSRLIELRQNNPVQSPFVNNQSLTSVNNPISQQQYIPSPTPGILNNNEKPNMINNHLQQADFAEQQALKVLKELHP